MKQILLLLALIIMVSCEKEEPKKDNTPIRLTYDEEYFSGTINDSIIQVKDTLLQIGFSNDMLPIEGYKMSDSVLWRFSTLINDKHSNSYIQIHYFIRELFSNLDTCKTAYHTIKYKYFSVLEKRFKRDAFSLRLDSINYNRPGYILKNNNNLSSAIVVEYGKNGKKYNSYQNSSIKDFEILDSYIKPVIVNIHADGSGYDIDSVLYIRARFNCQFNLKTDTIALKQCEYKAMVDIKHFND